MPQPTPLQPGERRIHTTLGPGTIHATEERMLAGTTQTFVIFIPDAPPNRVMLPETTASALLRPIVSPDEARQALHALAQPSTLIALPWNRRHQRLRELTTGVDAERNPIALTLLDTAEVVRTLHALAAQKDLSFAERRMAQQARAHLTGELASALETTPEDIETRIDAQLN